jgi:hypothetical protein
MSLRLIEDVKMGALALPANDSKTSLKKGLEESIRRLSLKETASTGTNTDAAGKNILL